MLAVLVVIVVFAVLILAEYLSRFKKVHSEVTRKIVHILVGVFVAFWPFFLSWPQIQVLSLAFILVIFVSVKLNIFKAIHAVERNTSGEILFALSMFILSTFAQNQFVFMAAMLCLSLSDGLAALIGKKFGGKTAYKIFGDTKSIVGSLVFFAVSIGVMSLFSTLSQAPASSILLVWLPLILTIVENISRRGSDNITIPVISAVVLTFIL